MCTPRVKKTCQRYYYGITLASVDQFSKFFHGVTMFPACEKNIPMKNYPSVNYRATRMYSADYAVARCPSVRPSVCLSVRRTPVFCQILIRQRFNGCL